MGLALGIKLTLGGPSLFAQISNLKSTVENYQTPQDQKIQELQNKLEEIQKELIELKQANLVATEPHPSTTAKASAPTSSHTEGEPEITDPSNPKAEPFALADSPGSPATRAPKILRMRPSSLRRRSGRTSTTRTTSAIHRMTPSVGRVRSFVRAKCS